MNSSAIILKELQELSPALAAVPRVNVYAAPQGYFDHLADDILMGAYAIDIQDFREKMSATVPEGYFDQLADNILSRIKNESQRETGEVDSASPVLNEIGKGNLYKVPHGYFETLPEILLEKVAGKTGITVFEETEMISSVVAELGNKNVFSVPEGYFESFKVDLVETGKESAKVVSMQGRRNIFRYAAAAVITGIIAVSSFFIMNNRNSTSNTERAAVMAEAKNILKTGSFDEKLATVSDEAIVNFLESKGQDVEAALVASLSDDKNLPSTTDYLFSDETLDNVLKTIDLNN